MNVTLPPLPPLPAKSKADQKNWMEMVKDSHAFTEDAHWVIPGHLMQGKHPIRECYEKMPGRVHDLVHRARCTTFVCLQSECPPQQMEIHRSKSNTHVFGGLRHCGSDPFLLPQYRPLVELAMQSRKEWDNNSLVKVPSFVHYGIADLSPAKDLKELAEFVNHLATRILNGEVIYLHCWGGKGRSGLVAACLLGVLYKGISADEALQRIGAFCKIRHPAYHSPETSEQEDQVRDFFALM